MATPQHYVIIGNGVAGNQAASVLRERDPDSRITIISAGRLLFYNRYQLPMLFGHELDWRDFLVHQPTYYQEMRINVRRNSLVASIDSGRKVLHLAHKEEVRYDQLLVASGGRNYLPETLTDRAHLLDGFLNYRSACVVRDRVPRNGKVVMLGGDMIGLDLARNLVREGLHVTLVAGETTFWPHVVDPERRPDYLDALRRMGIEVIESCPIETVEEGAPGMSARKVVLGGGREIFADVVMPFLGLVPSVEFMLGSGVDIERGLLVNPRLQTTDASIWAAGDVCQIWSAEENRYRFYYGWKNVKKMGEIAALNMTGGDAAVDTISDEALAITESGLLDSPYWEYD